MQILSQEKPGHCGMTSRPQYTGWWMNTFQARWFVGPKPWITRTIWALHRKRNKLFKKQKALKKSKDDVRYKQAKAKVQRAEQQAYWQHLEKVVDFGDPNGEDRLGK